MQPENNPIDDLFRNQLEGEQINPPSRVWEEVRLQTQVDMKFRNALTEHRISPPSEVWKHIYRHLHPAKPYWLRPSTYAYVAAASLTIFALFFFGPADNTTGLSIAHTPRLPDVNTQDIPIQSSQSEILYASSAGETSRFTNTQARPSVSVIASVETLSDASDASALKPTTQISSAEAADLPSPSIAPSTSDILNLSIAPSVQPFAAAPYLAIVPEPLSNSNQNKAWMVSSLFSPDVNFGGGHSLGTALGESSQGRMQYSAGVRLGYALNDRWSVQSGILYSDRGQQLMPRGEQDNYVGNPSFMRVGAPVEVKAQIIDIPVVMRYKIVGNKLRWFMHSGISANITGGASSMLFGTGTEFAPGNGFSVSLEPTWRRMIEILPNMRPNSVGILTGVNYRF